MHESDVEFLQKSLAVNALWNILRNSLNILFPLLTFPYISRVMGPENLGIANYVLSVVSYFTLFSTFGIPLYGTRELSKVKNDKERFNKLSNELFIISLVSSAIVFTLYIFLVFSIPQFSENKLLFIIAGFIIIFNAIGFEWLYQSLEEFSYITKRTIIVKLATLIFLFAFVRTEEDLIVYLILNVFSTVCPNIINLLYSKRYIKVNFFRRDYSFRKHLKPLLVFLSTSLVSSLYMSLDVVILGTITNNYESVGLYYTAVKINRLAITIFAAVSLVVIPRSSMLIENKSTFEYQKLIQRLFNLNLLFALPLVSFLIIFSADIIFILSGPLYKDAIPTMQLLTPIILIAAFTNLMYNQVLIPNNMERAVLITSIFAASSSIFLNLILTPILEYNGTAIATLVTELIVLSFYLKFGFTKVKEHFFSKNQLKIFYSVIVMTFILIVVDLTLENIWIRFYTGVILGGISYILMLFIQKELTLVYLLNKILLRINKGK
jgi:O-antigen/teichoic acid export membrane protein